MSKTFRPWNHNQDHLFPRSLKEYVPEGHAAHFVVKLVSEELDLHEIIGQYNARGYPPHSPRMMTAVLLYGYMRGVYSSRKLSQACEERTDFMVVRGMSVPDHRPIAEFRKRHGAALNKLFIQVLELCREANLFNLEHVAIDGTKLKGNASMAKNACYKQLKEAEEALVDRWLEEAEKIDEQEDAKFGEQRGDEFPPATKERTAPPEDKQYNFTDPDSGAMRSSKRATCKGTMHRRQLIRKDI